MDRVIGKGRKGGEVVAFSDRNQPWGEVEELPSGNLSLWSTYKCVPFFPHMDQQQTQQSGLVQAGREMFVSTEDLMQI